MSMFLCLVRPDGTPIPDDVRHRYARRREAQTHLPVRWCMRDEFVALVGSDVPGVEPAVAHVRDWIGVGLVRLDNRLDVERGLPDMCAESDLEVVLHALDYRGVGIIEELFGDFAFVAWNRSKRELIASRDAFGVRPLYASESPSMLAFSTRASLLADGAAYNLEYFAEYIVNGPIDGITPFTGVAPVRAGEILIYERGSCRRRRYWPGDVLPSACAETGREPVARFRGLLSDAVRARTTNANVVWSQLSGGMDSSSVAAVAQTQAGDSDATGLAGTVTYVTTPPIGGDRAHAAAVARHYHLRNEVIGGWWLWQEDAHGPPLLDQPSMAQATYALDRRVAALVHGAGGRILLSGAGADLCLRPRLDGASDLIAQGQLVTATRVLAQWAAAARLSFWVLAFRHGIYPLLPSPLRRTLARPAWQVPAWIAPEFARRFEIATRTFATRAYAGGRGDRAIRSIQQRLLGQGTSLLAERMGELNLEWRYPFLSRALVEYALPLPAEWRFAPGASKRILREAMRGILPEEVRTRQGKGGVSPQFAKALQLEQGRLVSIARSSRLAELGCVVPNHLAHAIATVNDQMPERLTAINNALSLELWLRRREQSVAAWS